MRNDGTVRWLSSVLWGLFFLLGVVLMLRPTHLFADVDCARTSSHTLNFQETKVNSNGTSCFRVYVSPGTLELHVEMEAMLGDFDLHVANSRTVSRLRDAGHKYNLLPITPSTPTSIYIIPDPHGYYTIGVTPRSNGYNRFRLKVRGTVSAIASSSPSHLPPLGKDEAWSADPVKTSAGVDILGSEYGASVIYPIQMPCPGPIQARATWTGSARNLALTLNGPGQTGYFERKYGGEPLTLHYNVTDEYMHRGNRWWISLTNFEGGTADVTVSIDYGDFCVTTSALTRSLENNVTNLRVNSATDERMTLTVDYTYDGSQGNDVYLYVSALHAGQIQRWFTYRPTPIKRGSGTATVAIGLSEGQNLTANMTTEQLQFRMYVGSQPSFYQQTFDFAKNWTPANSIDGFRILRETDTEVTYLIDYFYIGDRGTNTGLRVYPIQTQIGQPLRWFDYIPGQVVQGKGTATVTLYLPNQSNSVPMDFTTDRVQFEMYDSDGSEITTRHFDYVKRWTTDSTNGMRNEILGLLYASNVPNSYPSQAEQFVDALIELRGEFVYLSDIGDRINGVVNAIWGDWANRSAQQGFDMATTDPGGRGFSPFRQLVIRMIQGRQSNPDDAQLGAINSFLTRSENPNVWRDQMNGVIGALNREFFP